MRTHHLVTSLPVAMLALLTAPALAQIGPSLVIEPWKPVDQWADTTDEPTLIDGGNDDRSGEDIDIFYWDSEGRVKFDRHDPDPNVWFGYRVLAIDLDSDIPDFPRSLWDIAVVGAVKLGGSDSWDYTLMAGAGTANDAHFSNGDAVYGIGNFNAAHTIDADSSLHIGLNYNGNRTFWPDVPLPYAEYQRRVDDSLSFTLGVPRSGVVWKPVEQIVLTAEYTVPTNLYGNASWYFTEGWSVFGEYRQTVDGFYLDDQDNRRIFYDWQRVATGVRVETKWFDARLGVGWAFDQEFSRGYDLRDTTDIVSPDDGLLMFFTLQGTF